MDLSLWLNVAMHSWIELACCIEQGYRAESRVHFGSHNNALGKAFARHPTDSLSSTKTPVACARHRLAHRRSQCHRLARRCENNTRHTIIRRSPARNHAINIHQSGMRTTEATCATVALSSTAWTPLLICHPTIWPECRLLVHPYVHGLLLLSLKGLCIT